jgi:hypothetical protein
MALSAFKAYIEVSMQFDPVKHTKEFLLENNDQLEQLAKHSPEFAKHSLAEDFQLLNCDVSRYETPRYEKVAHLLARHQVGWLKSNAVRNIDVLMLKDKYGKLVAHTLAESQSDWMNSDDAKNVEILKLSTEDGYSVAHSIIHTNKDPLSFESVSKKEVLTLERNGKLLAEYWSQKHGRSYRCMGFTIIAMKLISQGAAYKHSGILSTFQGGYLLSHAKTMFFDSLDPLVKLKHLQAFYSTFYHQVVKIESTAEQSDLGEWQSMLTRVGDMLEIHLNEHPELCDMQHTIDFFCEPGDVFVKHYVSARFLKESSGLASQNEAPELPTKAFLF